ncbi:hypothetical protein N9515_00890 [Vicingaceae bacterium]|nr:hypothetical protein [Vicingaceae bacterium]
MILVINLFYRNPLIEYDLDSSDCELFDFQGENSDGVGFKNIIIDSFENHERLFQVATHNFNLFIRELSNSMLEGEHVRNFQINGLPIFWLTSISEKLYYHWLVKAFFLKELIKTNDSYFKGYNEIIFLIPDRYKGTVGFLNGFLMEFNLSTSFLFSKKNKENKYVRFFKISVKQIISYFTVRKPILKNKNYRITFISSLSQPLYSKNFIKNILSVAKIKEEEVSFIPIELFHFSDNLVEYEIPEKLWYAKPIFWSYLNFIYKCFNLILRLNKVDSEFITVNKVQFPTTLLINELQEVLILKNDLLLMNLWLSRFKEGIDNNGSFFYEDEFHPGGRAISHGLQGLNTYGMQHSMYGPSHNLYNFSDEELYDFEDITRGMPRPKKFIVWGDYFKKLFLLNNSLPDSFILSLGNPSFIKKLEESKLIPKTNKKNVVLYCLTRYEIFLQELVIVKKSLLTLDKFKLIVRFHPLWKFEEELVLEMFKDLDCEISFTEDVFEDMKSSNLVITSAHSGVWLESYILKIPTIRVQTFMSDQIEDSSITHTVKNSQEMEESLYKMKRNSYEHDNDFLYLRKDRWQAFIKEVNA